MKNIYLAALFLFLLPVAGLCQLNEIMAPRQRIVPVHRPSDICLSASPNILFNTPNGVQAAGGLRVEMFLGKYVSFDSDLMFGRDYIHAGIGIIGIPVWLLVLSGGSGGTTSLGEMIAGGILMALTAEHTSLHLPVTNSVEVSPYISLLRYKWAYKYDVYNNPNSIDEQFCFVTGMSVNKYFKRLQFSPYAEYTIGYLDHISGFNTGINLGIYLPSKRR